MEALRKEHAAAIEMWQGEAVKSQAQADARVKEIQEAADEIAKKYQEHLESIGKFFDEESCKTKQRFEERAKVAESKADEFTFKAVAASQSAEDRVITIRD